MKKERSEIAVSLLRKEKISFGKAVEISGLSSSRFEELLKNKKCLYRHYFIFFYFFIYSIKNAYTGIISFFLLFFYSYSFILIIYICFIKIVKMKSQKKDNGTEKIQVVLNINLKKFLLLRKISRDEKMTEKNLILKIIDIFLDSQDKEKKVKEK